MYETNTTIQNFIAISTECHFRQTEMHLQRTWESIMWKYTVRTYMLCIYPIIAVPPLELLDDMHI